MPSSPASFPRQRPWLLCLLVSMAAAGSAPTLSAASAEGRPASLRALLELTGPEAVDAGISYSELDALLAAGLPTRGDALSDGSTLPEASAETLEPLRQLGCGSAALRAAARLAGAADRTELALITAGPRLAAARDHAVAGEPFFIRYDLSAGSRHAVSARDADRDGLADAVGELSSHLRLSSRRVAEITGWTPRTEMIEVVLGRTPFEEGATLMGARPMIVIPTDLRGPALLAAVAHQVAHAAVQDQSPGMPEPVEEALATYLAEAILAESAGLELNLEQLLPRRHAARAFLSEGPLAARGDANFLRFIGAELDPAPWLAQLLGAFPRQFEDARRRLDPRLAALAAIAESLDRTLASNGWSLPEAVSSYQKWTLEQDLLAHGQAVSVDADLGALPAEEERRADSLAAFGQLRFAVEVPSAGGLRLAFDGDARFSATALALLDDGRVREFAVGRPSRPTLLPAGQLARVVVLVQSPELPGDWNAATDRVGADAARADRSFHVASSAEPGFPFTMTAFGAEAAPSQVTLSWDTSGEQDVAGWWIERALRPAGPFIRLSTAPMPPLAWPGERSAYAFVDRTVRPSTRYHYRVVAMTASGLREISPVTSLRTLPSTQRPLASSQR